VPSAGAASGLLARSRRSWRNGALDHEALPVRQGKQHGRRSDRTTPVEQAKLRAARHRRGFGAVTRPGRLGWESITGHQTILASPWRACLQLPPKSKVPSQREAAALGQGARCSATSSARLDSFSRLGMACCVAADARAVFECTDCPVMRRIEEAPVARATNQPPGPPRG